jgi:hypothetical protein
LQEKSWIWLLEWQNPKKAVNSNSGGLIADINLLPAGPVGA